MHGVESRLLVMVVVRGSVATLFLELQATGELVHVLLTIALAA